MMTEAPRKKKTCFIVGPIGESSSSVRKLADWIMKGLIKPVLEEDEFDYDVKRADHDADPGSITSSVIEDLVNSDLVIADLTGFNPNAFYELGIRHALRKPAIHMTAEMVRLPFDNSDQRTIFVDILDFDSVTEAKSRLRSAVRAVNRDGYQVTNPFVQATAVSALKDSADPRDRVIATLEERLSRLEESRSSLLKEAAIANAKLKTFSTRKGLFGLSMDSGHDRTFESSMAFNDEAKRAISAALLPTSTSLFERNDRSMSEEELQNYVSAIKLSKNAGNDGNGG